MWPQGVIMLSLINKQKQYLKQRVSEKTSAYQARLVQGRVHVDCRDPLVVRADILVLDTPTQTLSAVVDGMVAELGPIGNDIHVALAAYGQASLSAPHFNGGQVSRQVPVIIHEM